MAANPPARTSAGRSKARARAAATPAKRADTDQLINEAEALQMLGGISKDQLRTMRDRRLIAYVPMASGSRYWRGSIVAWLEAATVEVGELPR